MTCNQLEQAMPKAFDDREKQAISEALATAGLKHFTARGIRGTRIDDICRDVGIAKGSFYAFHASKEDLLMSIAADRDIAHKADMLTFLNQPHPDTKTLLAGFFDFMMERIETDPLLKIFTDRGEIHHLIRKVSPQLIAENQQRDHDFMAKVADLLQSRYQLKHADKTTLEGLMVMMLSLSLQAEFIKASGDYPATINLMRDAFLTRLLKGPYHD